MMLSMIGKPAASATTKLPLGWSLFQVFWTYFYYQSLNQSCKNLN